ncbi:hypothetical protein BKA56DRAFT_619784 [Ilyonectria sp. MPI-CAGE-AT-0026]|nr:hypothetical protein BKA56DRAFT_619784 [Ilyonectria sp. MPI-CAGE-AT-0026]
MSQKPASAQPSRDPCSLYSWEVGRGLHREVGSDFLDVAEPDEKVRYEQTRLRRARAGDAKGGVELASDEGGRQQEQKKEEGKFITGDWGEEFACSIEEGPENIDLSCAMMLRCAYLAAPPPWSAELPGPAAGCAVVVCCNATTGTWVPHHAAATRIHDPACPNYLVSLASAAAPARRPDHQPRPPVVPVVPVAVAVPVPVPLLLYPPPSSILHPPASNNSIPPPSTDRLSHADPALGNTSRMRRSTPVLDAGRASAVAKRGGSLWRDNHPPWRPPPLQPSAIVAASPPQAGKTTEVQLGHKPTKVCPLSGGTSSLEWTWDGISIAQLARPPVTLLQSPH